MTKNKVSAFVKYWGFRKWVAMLNDPLGMTEFLSGGNAELTQANERYKYEQFKNGEKDSY